MAPRAQNFVTLICLGCESSIRVRRGDLPERCEECRHKAGWRIAFNDELTKTDLKFLRSIRIAVDDP